MITIGTAGHIDHGKSAIVRRLTGTDPDRLPEEKARGMTIDLGFAFYRTPSGDDIALVDVPGHERFVKNMIAGAGGIDAVMLVVAADDGWMPQSEEHFQITKLLGIRHGWVVINKCDLAQSDWLDLLESDIRDKLSGSFLDGCPILRISAETGEGFDDLRKLLDNCSESIPPRTETGKARLFIDRSFVRPGIGGVVTGTLRGGTLSEGQTVSVWPSLKVGRIRILHSHGEEVSAAGPGQRTAVSLTGVDKELLIRGGVISERIDLSYFQDNRVLALQVRMTPNAPLPITDRRRALIIVGTTEAEGEIRIFDNDQLGPSSTGIVFFRPDEPIYALAGDHFIVRLPTPMVTLGGGTVLDHIPSFPRRKQLGRLGYLSLRLEQSTSKWIESEFRKLCAVKRDSFLSSFVITFEERDKAVQLGLDDGTIGSRGEYLYDKNFMAEQSSLLYQRIEKQFSEHSHLTRINLETVTALSDWPEEITSVIIDVLVDKNKLSRDGNRIAIAGRETSLSGAVKQAYEKIMAELREDKYAPPSLSNLSSGGKNFQQAIGYIFESGEGSKCGSEFIFLKPVWDEILLFVREILTDKDELRPADLREKFGFSRKYAIPILEETDRLKLTRRDGDLRRKGELFGSEHSLS